MERFDIAVIGTGPAGLEAAITAKVRNKSVLLLGGKALSGKVQKAHQVLNYLGLPGVTGEEMQKAFAEHLKSMDIEITEDQVNVVYALGDYFAIQGHKENYEAKSVILAAGVSVAKPFAGELENLGRGVSYCATCDAALYKGKNAVVLGYSDEAREEADFLSEIAESVEYIPMDEKKFKDAVISRDEAKMKIVLDGDKKLIDGIFILRESVAPSQLVPGLAIEKNQVVVDRSMKTNIEGLYACGDITGAPFQYIKAAGEGNVAALSAVSYLTNKKN